jgi:ribosome-associated translation inhibitor RaiA
MNNCNIEISGFVASKDLIEYAENRLEWLEPFCPADSYIKLLLSKSGNSHSAEIYINAHAVKFHSTQSDKSIAKSIIKLINAIEVKLNKWKALRFDTPTDLIKIN